MNDNQEVKIGMTDGGDSQELQPTCMRAFDGWISVKTRMPNERCLAYTPDQDEQGTWRIIPKGYLSKQHQKLLTGDHFHRHQ